MVTPAQVSIFTPQDDIPLDIFLLICDQSKVTPAPSHDREWHKDELQAYQQVIVRAHKKQQTPLHVLEVGCGTGRIGPYLAGLDHVKNYTGIDVVPEYLEYFRGHAPTLTLCNQDIFKLEEECQFGVILVPFTTLHLFTFPLQQALIKKLIRNHAQTACFDVMLPDWGGHTERFTWTQVIQVGDFSTSKESYALAHKDYKALAIELGVELSEDEYFIRSTDGKHIKHSLITFSH